MKIQYEIITLRKYDPYHVRLTIRGDTLPHPSDSGYPAATLLETKIIFSSAILNPGSQFMCADIKNYFLYSPMERFGYIKTFFRWIPKEIRIHYL